MVSEVNRARYLGDYRIHVEFSNGEFGVVDLEQDLWGPVFEPLKDLEEFKKFFVSETPHTLVWKNGVDFAPEHLHEICSF